LGYSRHMKRSEMVKFLQETFIKHMNSEELASTDEEMYSMILRDLENEGMLPPFTDLNKGSTEHPSWYANDWDKE